MIFNQGTDTTLEPAYFARVQNSDVMGKYEGRIRELEEQQKETTATITTIQSKDTEQDNKLVELEEEIATHSSDIATMKGQIEALADCDVTDSISTETINSICTFTSTFD